MPGHLAALFALLPLLPACMAFSPAARWGHDAVYVPSQNAMYVIGGQVLSPGVQVTNDVLIYTLNGTSPTWTVGPSTNLPPHAFASTAITPDGNSVVVIGGMTSDCSTDSLAHTLELKGNGSWTHADPTGLVRRRGAGIGAIKDGGKLILVGGVSDTYSCASDTKTYPSVNTLTLPLGTGSIQSTQDIPSGLTGSTLAVSDFAMTTSSDGKKMYLLSGQASSGSLVSMDNVGVWTASTGWTNQKVGGNIPVGRVGASLVAHPTLDVLILHGGARDDRGSDLSTSLLALLNTTSWQWTIPSSLQPPQSSAVSYHSAIMTPSGVMVSAFGMSGSGSPRSDMYFLDMRDNSMSTWSWKSSWNSNMLQAYVAPATDSTSTGGGSTAPNTGMGSSSSRLASIVAPVVILSVIAIPLIVFFIRRKMRIEKKRRMARHFSFSSQEDGGDFPPLTGGNTARFNQYPFSGPDGNEKENTSLLSGLTSNVTGLATNVSGFVDRLRGRSKDYPEMREKGQGKKGGKFNEKSMKWEEIDFGLGEVDSRRGSANVGFIPSSRRSSFSATGSPPETARYIDAMPMSVPLPMASGIAYNGQTFNLVSANMPQELLVTITSDDSPRVGTPQWDGQQPLIPSLVVLPPTVPPTPASLGEYIPDQIQPPSTPPRNPMVVPDEGLDWNMLQQDLDSRPAFRSISPNSPLRSHQQSHQPASSPTPPRINTQFRADPFSDRHVASPPTTQQRSASPISPVPALPYLDFQQSQSPISAAPRPQSPAGSFIVNPKTGRRTSTEAPMTPPGLTLGQSPRSVSSPMGTRQLVGNYDRRGSAPTFYTAPSSPASPSPASPAPVIHTAQMGRRGSGPVVGQLMGSPMGRSGSLGGGPAGERRGSHLRVMNNTEDEDEVAHGRAI